MLEVNCSNPVFNKSNFYWGKQLLSSISLLCKELVSSVHLLFESRIILINSSSNEAKELFVIFLKCCINRFSWALTLLKHCTWRLHTTLHKLCLCFSSDQKNSWCSINTLLDTWVIYTLKYESKCIKYWAVCKCLQFFQTIYNVENLVNSSTLSDTEAQAGQPM